MAESSENSEYLEVSIALLLKVKRPLFFDLYVQRSSSKYSKILKKNDTIDVNRIEAYEKKGIKYFFITREDYKIYTAFISKLGNILSSSSQRFNPNESVEILKELTIFTVHELSTELNVSNEVLEGASIVVSESVGMLEQDPKLAFRLISLLCSQKNLLKQSISTSIFSVLVAKKMGIVSKSNLELIGLGALLHDVGMAQLNFDPEETDILTRDQRKELNRHPELGKQLLDTNNVIKREVLQIILQHHEQPNGLGYPNCLKDKEIYPPAKIVAIVSCFVALISDRAYRKGVSKDAAFSNLEDSRDKFDAAILRHFKELLYPNGRTAKVSSSSYS